MTVTAATVPVYVGLEINLRCNLACPHCITCSHPGAFEGPDLATLKRWFTDLAGAGVSTIGFSGGEPLLRDDLEDVMQSGLDAGLAAYGVATNGIPLTAKRARALARLKLTSAQVSVDGLDAKDYCSVRHTKPDAYYGALRGIRYFREAGIPVDMAVLLNATNLERLPQLALLGESLGIRQLRWCSYVPTGRGVAAHLVARHTPSPERLDAFLDLMRRLNSTLGAPLKVSIDHGIGPWVESGAFPCQSGRTVAYISSTGDVYPCPGLLFPEFIVGNINQTAARTLLTSQAIRFADRLDRTKGAEPCRSCPNTLCSGGCRGYSYALCGDIHASPPYCNVRRRGGQSD